MVRKRVGRKVSSFICLDMDGGVGAGSGRYESFFHSCLESLGWLVVLALLLRGRGLGVYAFGHLQVPYGGAADCGKRLLGFAGVLFDSPVWRTGPLANATKQRSENASAIDKAPRCAFSSSVRSTSPGREAYKCRSFQQVSSDLSS